MNKQANKNNVLDALNIIDRLVIGLKTSGKMHAHPGQEHTQQYTNSVQK